MKRRQFLADCLRCVRAKEADNLVRLTDETQRWCQWLTNQESRNITHLLDSVVPITPAAGRVLIPKELRDRPSLGPGNMLEPLEAQE